MNLLVEEVVEALRGAGWTVKLTGQPRPLPVAVTNRHSTLPPLAVEFFTNVQRCVEPEECSWFLAAEDFARTDGFRWDEYERMFIEDAARNWRRRSALSGTITFLSFNSLRATMNISPSAPIRRPSI